MELLLKKLKNFYKQCIDYILSKTHLTKQVQEMINEGEGGISQPTKELGWSDGDGQVTGREEEVPQEVCAWRKACHVAGNRGTGVEIKGSNAQDLFNESLF